MINYLRETINNHIVLYHDGKHNKLLRMKSPPEEKIDFDQFINTHQNLFGIQHNKSLFIGLAWVLPME